MADTVIVALPSEDDHVYKISSEEKPHLTLMYLGENLDMDHFEEVVRYIQHVAKTSMHRFGLSVDRRGTLGPKDADVVFFQDGWQTKEIKEIQGYLRADDHISNAYHQSKQFAKWIPHLTLGYPDSPAKPDEREYPGLHYVSFDRIAIWNGDYDGPEFRLESNSELEDLCMSEAEIGSLFAKYALREETVLSHYGVPGMQWGKTKVRTPTGVEIRSTPGKRVKAKGGKFEEASADAKVAAAQKQVARKSSTDALSNQDLKKLVERMQLEANYDRLVKQQQGNDIVRKLFLNKDFREKSTVNLRGLGDNITMPVRVARGPGNIIRKTDLSGIGR